jgi:hypothetical protein
MTRSCVRTTVLYATGAATLTSISDLAYLHCIMREAWHVYRASRDHPLVWKGSRHEAYGRELREEPWHVKR